MNKKCAIFNYWWSWRDAHGASLTALALYKLLEELGYEPYLIITIFRGGGTIEQCKNGRHFRFIKKYARYIDKNYQTEEEYAELGKKFEHFIVGSDQVLRTEWVPDELFLYSVEKNKNKIVMSGSFGGKQLASSEQRIQRIAGYLREFSAISVREKDAIEVYQEYFGEREDIEWIMDPVFLIDSDFYYDLIKNRTVADVNEDYEKKVIFFYVLNMNSEMEKVKQKINETYKTVIVEDGEELMAEDFLYLVANCSMVVTDSFHGMCFSILLNKPFYCIYNKLRGTSRMDTLSEVFCLEDVCLEVEQIDECDFSIPNIDYATINMCIEQERERGRCWLKEKLVKHEQLNG